MANLTDLFPARADEHAESTAADVLGAVADHFTEVRPTEPMDPQELLVTIGAEAYNACGRSLGGRSAELARAAQAAAPAVVDGITRGEYALQLRKAASAGGYEWTEDDNRPVIPTIPGQRRESARSVLKQPDAPVCCGRPMRRDGAQFVCRKCGGYFQGGAA
jgi:hypothetical protein